MGKILITGALGNIGGYVAKYALQRNQEVVLADIDTDSLHQKYGKTVTCAYFDFTDTSTFNEALHDVDRLFIVRPPHLGKANDMLPFIQSLKDRHIQLVCFLSLIGVEKNPFPPHHKIEKYIEDANIPFCHIRPSFFMQNISGIHAFEIKHFNQIVVPVKKAVTSFIDGEDIGELIATILSTPQLHQNTKYAITGPEAIDYFQVSNILTKHLERSITYANPKPRLAKKYWIDIRGLDKTYATVMSMLYLMTRLGTAKTVTNTFETIMHKKPQTFEQFVMKNISSWK